MCIRDRFESETHVLADFAQKLAMAQRFCWCRQKVMTTGEKLTQCVKNVAMAYRIAVSKRSNKSAVELPALAEETALTVDVASDSMSEVTDDDNVEEGASRTALQEAMEALAASSSLWSVASSSAAATEEIVISDSEAEVAVEVEVV